MYEKIYTDLILISPKLFKLLEPTPDAGGETGGGGFSDYNIFSESYFEGTPVQIAVKITTFALNIILTLGILFFAWKVCSAAMDYFNRDIYSINARSQGRTLFYEIMEPVKGLAILVILTALLNAIYGTFLPMLEGEAQQFEIQETSAFNTTEGE